MTDINPPLEQWSTDAARWLDAIIELRTRIETLEIAAHKHIVETSANILAVASRVESLEAAEREASKVYQISKPLKLTPEQAQQVRDLLAPNSKPIPNSSQTGRLLVERVHSCIVGEPECGHMQARAAIREVAEWLRQHYGGPTASSTALEQEAEQ